MGVSYTACVVYGVKVPKESLIEKKETHVNNHKHDVPEGARFCPVCGDSLYAINRKHIIYDTDYEDSLEVFGGFDASDDCIVGVSVACVLSDFKLLMPDAVVSDEVKARVIDTLSDIGIDMSTIGTWLVMEIG